MKTSILQLNLLAAAAGVAATAAAVLLSAPARAGDSEQQSSVTVHFRDLDLASPRDATKLYMRIKLAAATVCGDETEVVELTERRDIDQCMRQSIESAVERVNQPQLTVVYDRHYPREPVTVAMSSAFR